MNLYYLTKEERTYMFGLQRLEDAFKTIDSRVKLDLNILFVHCNKEGWEQVKHYVLNGVHAIWNFKIIHIEEETLRIEYLGVPIVASFNIRGAY